MTADLPSSPFGQRPHMVMLVGNHVVGDSRVEKSAVSALNAGYHVTIVGTRHRSTFQVGRYEQIPIYRLPITFPRQVAWNAWNAWKPTRFPDWSSLIESDSELKASRAPVPGREIQRPLTSRAVTSLRRIRRSANAFLDDHRGRPARVFQEAKAKVQAALPGGWRTVWPQTADYEDAFLQALLRLEPDIIHVHDRHPMPGAAAYAYLMRTQGHTVPWIYDAHEWLPGQHIGGPSTAKTGWLAAESQLIQRADAVLSVTDNLAERMQRRHHLDTQPATVVNAPHSVRAPMDPELRRPVRDECGLGPDVPLLVYVGRMTELRGVFTMIEALPLLPEVHVAFVGSKDDNLRQRMRERAETLRVAHRLHIFDYVPSTSVTWYIESATCGVSPLLSTPAHNLAMATKLREYAQAGLPMIVSDLTVQAAFVRDYGVGTVYEPGGSTSLAAATRRLLADLESHRSAVADEEFLDSQTWDGAEKVLTKVWHSLCPASGVQADGQQGVSAAGNGIAAPNPTRGRTLVVVGASDGNRLAEAWSRHGGPVLTRRGFDPTSDDEPQLTRALADWVETDITADAVLYRGLVAAHGDAVGGTLAELRSLLHSGKQVGLLTEAELVDPQCLHQLLPRHAVWDWDKETFDRFRRQVLRASRPMLELRDAGVPLFTTRRVAASVLDGVHWAPTPIQTVDAPSEPSVAPEHPARLLIVPTARSRAENSAIDRLVNVSRQAGLVVDRPRYSRFVPTQAARADIIVDALSLGDWTLAAAHAWSASRLVVGHFDHASPTSSDLFEPKMPTIPLVDSTPANLVDTVLHLTRTISEAPASDLRRAGRHFAATVHDGRMTVERMRAVWGL